MRRLGGHVYSNGSPVSWLPERAVLKLVTFAEQRNSSQPITQCVASQRPSDEPVTGPKSNIQPQRWLASPYLATVGWDTSVFRTKGHQYVR